MKQKGFLELSKPDEAELAEIHKFTKRTFTADEIYAFSVVLCDNEIDRDFERFTPDTLEGLAKLFVGKPGIFDHSMKGRDQVARTYSCKTERTGELTSDGEPYVRLIAKAYVPRTSKTKDFILNLEAGINKEVSVGCAVGEEICSVCGADMRRGACTHRKGEFYGDGANRKQCHALLKSPTDAYEWSFVAVPAQRKAGVVKSFNYVGKEEQPMKAEEIIKSFSGGDVTLTEAQTKSLKAEFFSMQAIVDEYKAQLKKNAVRCCAEALPQLCGDELEGILNALTPHQLKSFSEALVQKKAVKAQLANEKSKKQSDNTEFVI